MLLLKVCLTSECIQYTHRVYHRRYWKCGKTQAMYALYSTSGIPLGDCGKLGRREMYKRYRCADSTDHFRPLQTTSDHFLPHVIHCHRHPELRLRCWTRLAVFVWANVKWLLMTSSQLLVQQLMSYWLVFIFFYAVQFGPGFGILLTLCIPVSCGVVTS